MTNIQHIQQLKWTIKIAMRTKTFFSNSPQNKHSPVPNILHSQHLGHIFTILGLHYRTKIFNKHSHPIKYYFSTTFTKTNGHFFNYSQPFDTFKCFTLAHFSAHKYKHKAPLKFPYVSHQTTLNLHCISRFSPFLI